MSINTLFSLVIYIIVLGIIFWLLNYLIDNVPMDPNFKRVAKIVLLVLSVLVLIWLLLGLIGVGGPFYVPRIG
jgi:hypothetical protein